MKCKVILLFALLAPLLMAGVAHSQSAGASGASTQQTGGVAQQISQGFCDGTATSGGATISGAIPKTTILSGRSAGEGALLTFSILIMLTMLLVTAIIYMVGYIANIESLKQIVKAEIGEILITAVIVFIFIGGFNAIGASISQNGFSLAGNGFGRGIYVDDCTYLFSSSITLTAPLLVINLDNWILSSITSLKLNLEPEYFGFSVQPLAGYALYGTMLGILTNIVEVFILVNLGMAVVLGILYGLFPLFLYAGIIFRTLPWTRAAGGAFLGLFMGFYIAFPILLHIFLSGYVPVAATVAQGISASTTPNQIGQGFTPSNTNSGSGIFTYIAGFFSSLNPFGAGLGLINGFIYAVIEPASFTFIAIVISFMVSLDFADAVGDLLGAPSLSAGTAFRKVI